MNCSKVQNLISAYVDSELPGVEMLALREHLRDCPECSAEHEYTLKVKRAFGGLRPTTPTPGLTDRIILRIDQVSHTTQEHGLASLRKRLIAYPGQLRFAAAAMGVFAVLLTLRGGQLYQTIPFPQNELVASLSDADPGRMFPATSNVKYGHLVMAPSPAPIESWSVSSRNGGGMMLAGYSMPR